MKKILAIIPARANSKRLPNKNFLEFNGKPLVFWTLLLARDSKLISDVIVSTDSKSILNLHNDFPEFYFHERPEKLAADDSSILETILDIMKNFKILKFEDYDFLIVLQPTSPLRNSQDIERSLHLIKLDPHAQTCLSYTRLPSSLHPSKIINFEKSGYISESHTASGVDGHFLNPVSIRNGPAILIRRLPLKGDGIVAAPIIGYEMPWIRSIDIDTSTDFLLAEIIAKYLSETVI